MKNILLVLASMTIAFSACQQKEIVYSCDKKVNEWVHDNLTEIKLMSRSTWNNLDEDLKRASYRAFTQQQKVLFWKDKLNEVLAMEWNEAECEHIKKVLEFINEKQFYFDNDREITDEEQEEIDIFAYKWVEDAKDNLGWDMPLISSIVATGNTLLDKKGTVRTTTQSRSLEGGGCECEIEQIIAWCITSSCEESSIDCEPSDVGCGFLLIYPCNGSCGGI